MECSFCKAFEEEVCDKLDNPERCKELFKEMLDEKITTEEFEKKMYEIYPREILDPLIEEFNKKHNLEL